jgi:hypothetical protein
MSCRIAVSTLLTAALLISLLALDHPVAHASHCEFHFLFALFISILKFVPFVDLAQVCDLIFFPLTLPVKDQSIPTGDSSAVKKGLQQGVNRKLDGGKTTKFENVGAKMPNGQDAHQSFGSNTRSGGSRGVESNKAARRGGGPVPHPKKHN